MCGAPERQQVYKHRQLGAVAAAPWQPWQLGFWRMAAARQRIDASGRAGHCGAHLGVSLQGLFDTARIGRWVVYMQTEHVAIGRKPIGTSPEVALAGLHQEQQAAKDHLLLQRFQSSKCCFVGSTVTSIVFNGR